MKREYYLTALFFTVTAIVFYLFYEIIIPFFVPICWAAIFAILFFPLYDRVLAYVKKKWLASTILCSVIVILIIGPVTYLFIAIVNEAIDAVGNVNEMYQNGELQKLINFDLPLIATLKEKLNKYFDISEIDFESLVRDSVNKVSGAIVSQTTWIVTNFSKAVFYFGIMIFTMYYFFTEGPKIISKIKRLMPFSIDQVSSTFTRLHDIILATMYGALVIALIQGVMGGVLFWAVDIPSPILWGAVMAFLSILPVVGAFIVYIPAGIILMLSGSFIEGIIVLIIGTVVISQVDSVIRPFLISGKAAMHPLLLFFSILGGIVVFGLLGVILGPIIAALFMIIIDMFDHSLHPNANIKIDTPHSD